MHNNLSETVNINIPTDAFVNALADHIERKLDNSICCEEKIVYKSKCSGCGENAGSKNDFDLGE